MSNRVHQAIRFTLVAALLPACGEGAPPVIDEYPFADGPWLTWVSDPTSSVTISWLTDEPVETRVEWGLTPDAMDQVSVAAEATLLHHAALQGLQPDTVYYYRLSADFDQAPAGTIFSFRTAPVQQRPFRIGVVGDMQPRAGSLVSNRLMAEALAEVDVDVWLQAGDIVQEGDDPQLWHELLLNLPLFAAYTPIAPAIGNHDMRGVDSGGNWVDMFPLPYADVQRGRYYSLDYLGARVLVIDNYDTGDDHAERPSPEQLAWLETQLQQAQAADKWIFALMHTTIISTGTENMNYTQQEAMAPLFARYGVHGVFYGHDHMYEHYDYTYGADGLIYDPAHESWPSSPVHYWLTGGGGAALENEYGLTSNAPTTVTRTLYDVNTGQWADHDFERRPWNETNFVADALPEWSPTSPSYYHDCAVECYQDDAPRFGHDYGQNTLNYMIIEIDGDTCTVSARYPDGSLITGPTGERIQQWTFSKVR